MSLDLTRIMLERLEELLSKLGTTNASNKKIKILEEINHTNDIVHDGVKEILRLVYAPLITFGITRKAIEKRETTSSSEDAEKKSKPTKPKSKKQKTESKDTSDHLPALDYNGDLFRLLDDLQKRKLSGHAALDAAIYLMSQIPEQRELLLRIFDRNLKTRIGVKMLNAAYGEDFIVEFSVSLGFDMDKATDHFEKTKDTDSWFISRKFDGVRVIAKVNSEKAQCFSREGHSLPALENFETFLLGKFKTKNTATNPQEPWVLDGEVCVLNEDGTESFKDAVSQVKRKSHQMNSLVYHIFDLLTFEEFDSGTSTRTFSQRLETLRGLDLGSFSGALGNFGVVVVNQYLYNPESLSEMQKQVEEKGWEGLILRRDTQYQGKRSKDVLKVKKFFTEEFQVHGIETGKMRTVDPDTGLEIEEELLSAVKIMYKGHEVSVGSGFSHAERREYFAEPFKIIGKNIEVQYFEETTDKTGKTSLRFPTVKHIWGELRDI